LPVGDRPSARRSDQQEEQMGSKGRYVGHGALLAAGALTTTLAAEMLAAIRHKFIASEPMLAIGGVLGPDDGEPFTVAVLGDSSVAGVGAERPEDTLAYGVAAALAERHRVTLHCLGVSGARLANVVSEQLPQLAGLDADAVLVCVGTNDVTHGTSTRALRYHLRALASGLSTVAPNAVVVVSGLPPADVCPAFHPPLRHLLGLRAWALTRLYRSELANSGITLFDIAGETRPAFRGRREMFSDDLFHPSSVGYAYLGEIYGRAVREAVERARAAALGPDALPLAGDLAG
jgi:lysophospholipase L1-like esterase